MSDDWFFNLSPFGRTAIVTTLSLTVTYAIIQVSEHNTPAWFWQITAAAGTTLALWLAALFYYFTQGIKIRSGGGWKGVMQTVKHLCCTG